MKLRTLVIIVVSVALSAWTMLPIIWTVITSVTPRVELYSIPPHWIPYHLNLKPYLELFGLEAEPAGTGLVIGSAPDFDRAILNSAVVASATTVSLVAVSVLGGYALARLDFRGKNVIFLSFVATIPISLIAVYIPIFRMYLALGLFNTWQGLSLLYLSGLIPIGIWLMRSYFESLPWEVEDSALVDGCSRMQALVKVMLPMSVPGVMALVIFSVLSCWNEFLAALIFAPTLSGSKTITVLITEYVSKFGIAFDLMCAAAVISMIPPIILASLFQRYLISGLTMGAKKG